MKCLIVKPERVPDAYNYLNLPRSMIFDSGDTILYTYDAAGRKWSQETRSSQGVLSLRQYVGNMEFEGVPGAVNLKAVNHTEGRVVAGNGGVEMLSGTVTDSANYCADEIQSTQAVTSSGDVEYLASNGIKLKPGFSVANGGSFAAGWAATCANVTWQWQYYLKDHLGNVRVVFSDEDGDGAIQNDSEILEENHFYPFGMQMDGPWVSSASAGNRYRYNGKEQIEDFGLGWYDYGARFYDPSVGRFTGVDPLAEKYVGWSPYHYVYNNPLRFTDPDGRSADDIIDIDKSTGNISVTKAAGDDVVRLVNNGEVESSYTYGSNGSFSSDNIINRSGGGTTITFSQIVPGSADNAETFYQFAAQSDVEFGKLDVQAPSGEKVSAVTTSHDKTTTATLPGLANDYSERGFTGVKQSHSHPSIITNYNESVPSGHYDLKLGNPSGLMPFLSNGKKSGDALNAIQTRSLKGFRNTKFEVYAPGNNTRTTYDGINRAKIRKN